MFGSVQLSIIGVLFLVILFHACMFYEFEYILILLV